jgi:hypothetical protein
MTTELEKQFFDTFGIEPVAFVDFTTGYSDWIFHYPLITDHILLKLICIANKYGVLPYTTTIKNLKDRTLRILIKVQKYREKYLPNNDSTIKLPKTIRKTFKE